LFQVETDQKKICPLAVRKGQFWMLYQRLTKVTLNPGQAKECRIGFPLLPHPAPFALFVPFRG